MQNFKDLLDKILEKGLSDPKNFSREKFIEEFDKEDLCSLYEEGFARLAECSESRDRFISIMSDILLSNQKRIALFDLVSFEQYKKDIVSHGILEDGDDLIKSSYDSITLPKRGTKGSAGYDFICPLDITLKPGEEVVVCTGIRCNMEDNWVLKLYPRSSTGTKYRLQLNNTVGVIDSDYYFSNNEGHIMVKLTNDSKTGAILNIEKGDKLCQGVFVEYGITLDDCVSSERTGGFGSTGK